MFIGSLIMIIIGLLMIIGINKISKPIDYSTWKEADGIIEDIRTQIWDDGKLRPCLPRLYVVFEIDGKQMKGYSNYIGTEQTIKQVIAKYPKGTKVHFKYNDDNKTKLIKIADDLNLNNYQYIQIDDREFPSDFIDKKAKLFSYIFGLTFILIGIIGILIPALTCR